MTDEAQQMPVAENPPARGLAAALVDFQKIAPAIGKNRTANIPTKSGGSYKYSYADLSDMWDAIREPLASCGLAVTQQLVGGSTGWTGIRTTIWHRSGQHDSGTVEVPTSGKTAQEVGSQITYFKRYALGAALGISTEDDDDGKAGNAPQERPQRQQAAPTAYDLNAKEREELKAVCAEKKLDLPAVLKHYERTHDGAPAVYATPEDLAAFVALLQADAIKVADDQPNQAAE